MRYFSCPVCGEILILQKRSLICKNNHLFDCSKQGYVNLLKSNKKNHGDNLAMVQARTDFLNKGYYDALVQSLIKVLHELSFEVACDLGCGEGYYTKKLHQALPQSHWIGFDLSKNALKYASRQDREIDYAIANLFELPLCNESIDLALSLFAPLALNEISRILKKDGYFLCVTPNQRHLYELKEIVYDQPYENEETPIHHPNLLLLKSNSIQTTVTLNSNQDIQNLFSMTPYSFKTSLQDRQKLESLTNLTITLDFNIKLFKKSSTSA